MDQVVVFTILVAAIVATGFGLRSLALGLWGAALLALVGEYLFHATERLPLAL